MRWTVRSTTTRSWVNLRKEGSVSQAWNRMGNGSPSKSGWRGEHLTPESPDFSSHARLAAASLPPGAIGMMPSLSQSCGFNLGRLLPTKTEAFFRGRPCRRQGGSCELVYHESCIYSEICQGRSTINMPPREAKERNWRTP